VKSTADVLIVGSGAAGLTAALNLAETHKVAVIAKGALSEGATSWAQGGIAAVLEEGDSFEAHVNDTMIAGAGLNALKVVEHVVEAAPRAIRHLVELDVPFASENGALHLTREGGHSHRRIVHVADATGYAVQQALETAAAKQPNITLIPDMVAIDLVTGRHGSQFSTSGAVHGLYAYNRKKKRVETLTGKATILASGGAGRAYLYSTAPRGATGDGIAMAWRAGCRVSNMEMMQFHPTCLYNLQVKNFLITEAVRGEGGQLKLPPGVKGGGERFMQRFDERGELAPRDIVARAIDHEIKRLGLDYVHLDISHRDGDFVRGHFPNIYDKLLGLGIDITKESIPVVPHSIILAAGSWWTLTAAPMRRDSMPLERSRSPASTAPTASLRTASSNASCSARPRPSTSPQTSPICPTCRRFAPGTKAGSPIATRKSSSPRPGARSAASCGTMSASSAPPSGSSAPSTGSTCCGGRSRIITVTSG
jgi:L-aspartate oxidase